SPNTPTCPNSGGVIFYRDINYSCANEGDGLGYTQRTNTVVQNMPGSFNDRASSIRIPSGWSVKLYEHSDRGGGSACRNGSDDTFWSDQYNNGASLNDTVSSFEVFGAQDCQAPN